MPRPNHRRKIGASTTRGNELAIRMYGSNSAASTGMRARTKPDTTPTAAPIASERAASTNVVKRCGQMEPLAVQRHTRPTTSLGRLKKNGSRSPNREPHSHANRNAMPRASCPARTRTRVLRMSLVTLEHFLPQIAPYTAEELVEPRFHLDINQVSRTRKIDSVTAHETAPRAGGQ